MSDDSDDAETCSSSSEEEAMPRLTRDDVAPPVRQEASSSYEGVGVVVRVRPLSTLERADPSIHTCVQCLRNHVVVGGGAAATPSLASSSSTATPAGVAFPKPASAIPSAARPSREVAASRKPSPATPTVAPRSQQFHVDQVFHPHSTQIEVYQQSCRHIVEGVFQGVNGSILAYGTTGSGKTHTMFGGTMSAAGIVYQAVQDIFAEKYRLEEEEGRAVTVRCSFLEIYNEEVFDLLWSSSTGGVAEEGDRAGGAGSPKMASKKSGSAGSTSGGAAHNSSSTKSRSRAAAAAAMRRTRTALQVREVAKESRATHVNPESLVVCGLTFVQPQSVDDFARYIEAGHANRFVAATGANAQSSRSHAIITVEVVVASEAARGQEGTVARVRFCDLAGSERAASTSNSGLRMREGGSINRSLLALGAVVQSLVQKKRHPEKQVFIPYRGSKLTRLLRDSIGGNCRTQMVFCVSPSTRQYEESINTMLFAMQAKEIRVAARRHEYSVDSAILAKSQEQVIEELRAELAAARNELVRLGAPLLVKSVEPTSTTTAASSIGSDDPAALLHHCDASKSFASVSTVTLSPLASGAMTTALDPAALHMVTSPPPSAAPCSGGEAGTSKHESASVSASSGTSATSSAAEGLTSDPCCERSDDITMGRERGSLPLTAPPLMPFMGSSRSTGGTQQLQQPRLSTSAPPSPQASAELNPAHASLSDSHPLVASVVSALPAGGSRSLGRPTRPSIFQEGTQLFTELEAKLKSFTAEKEGLYHQMRDAEERRQDRDIKLREQKWRLAQFLASNAMNNRARGMSRGAPELTSGGTPVTPIGVAGLRQVIARMEAETESQDEQLLELAMTLDSIDRRIAATRQELLREKQQASLELLLDNAKLRQNCTEAECLAAHYHQECRTILNREEEYAQALQMCVGAIRAAMPLLPFTSPQLEQAKLALLYAGLPTAKTEDMLTVFENSLRAEATPPLAPPHTATVSSSSAWSPSRASPAGLRMESAAASPTHAHPSLPPMVPVSPKKCHFAPASDCGRDAAVCAVPDVAADDCHTPPRPAAAAGQRDGDGEGGVAGEASLEQHYRELVEAVSCLGNLSPTSGRGRRHQTPTRGGWADATCDREQTQMPADHVSGDVAATLSSTAVTETDAARHDASPGGAAAAPQRSPAEKASAQHATQTSDGLSRRLAPPPRSGSSHPPRLLLSEAADGGTPSSRPQRNPRKPSPYARTFSTSSFNREDGGGGGGNAKRQKRTPVAAPAVFARTHTVPVVSTSASASVGATPQKKRCSSPSGVGRRRGQSGSGGDGVSSAASASLSFSASLVGRRSCSSGDPPTGRAAGAAAESFRRVLTDTSVVTSRRPCRGVRGGGGSKGGGHRGDGQRAFSPQTAKGREKEPTAAPARGRPRRVAATAAGGGGSSGKKKKSLEEPTHCPVTTPLPKHQKPHIYVRGNTAFALRAGQAAAAAAAAAATVPPLTPSPAAAAAGPASTAAATATVASAAPAAAAANKKAAKGARRRERAERKSGPSSAGATAGANGAASGVGGGGQPSHPRSPSSVANSTNSNGPSAPSSTRSVEAPPLPHEGNRDDPDSGGVVPAPIRDCDPCEEGQASGRSSDKENHHGRHHRLASLASSSAATSSPVSARQTSPRAKQDKAMMTTTAAAPSSQALSFAAVAAFCGAAPTSSAAAGAGVGGLTAAAAGSISPHSRLHRTSTNNTTATATSTARKTSNVSTLTAEDDLLVSRSTCAETGEW